MPPKRPKARTSSKPAKPRSDAAPEEPFDIVSLAGLSGQDGKRRTAAAPAGHEPIHDPPGRGGGPETPAAPIKGLVCPQCGCARFRVLATRQAVGKAGEACGTLVRKRECEYCFRIMHTRERPM